MNVASGVRRYVCAVIVRHMLAAELKSCARRQQRVATGLRACEAHAKLARGVGTAMYAVAACTLFHDASFSICRHDVGYALSYYACRL